MSFITQLDIYETAPRPTTKEKQAVLRGLQILSHHDDDIEMDFREGKIFACDFIDTLAFMSREEIHEMVLCGWFRSEDAWCHHQKGA